MSLACVTSACLEGLIRTRSSLFNEPFHGALQGEKKKNKTPSETDFPIKFIEHEKGFWRRGSEVAGLVRVEAPPSSSSEDENKTNKQKNPGSR